jgi:hypothetical protein
MVSKKQKKSERVSEKRGRRFQSTYFASMFPIKKKKKRWLRSLFVCLFFCLFVVPDMTSQMFTAGEDHVASTKTVAAELLQSSKGAFLGWELRWHFSFYSSMYIYIKVNDKVF